MRDSGKIVLGLAIFAALATLPLWYNLASGQPPGRPELVKPVGETKCVESIEYMRASHMDMLNTWRDEVVRGGSMVYRAGDGDVYRKSLTGTCLRCHADRAKFCDRCHDYSGVKPFCWDCHVDHQGEQR